MIDGREHIVVRYQLAIVAVAAALLGLHWTIAAPTINASVVALAAGLTMMVAIGDRTELTFRVGGEALAATSATVPLLVSALFLPPAWAGVVAMTSYLLVELRGSDVVSAAFGASSTTIALIAASHVAQLLAGGPPPPELAIVVGFPAAIAFELLYNSCGMLMFELRRRGAAREFLRDGRPVIAFDIVLGIIGIVVVAPFGDNPIQLVAALIGFQLVAHGGLRMLNREQFHRGRATMLQRTFSRYVPAAVVQALIDSDETVELGGESREITVMFCDMRDFTSWAERTDPTDVLADLNDLLSELAQCVFATNGTLDKYTGDGLMAFWGAPAHQADHASRALEAALQFEAALQRHNLRRDAEGRNPLAIGVGIHSGQAIVGNVGHALRHDYTAIGDTVNVAARLEAASKNFGESVVLSRDTWKLLEERLLPNTRDAGDITVKGRSAALRVFVATAPTATIPAAA